MPIDLPNIEGKVKIDDSDLDRLSRKLRDLGSAQNDFAKGSDNATKANKRQSDSLFEVVKAGALMAGTMKLIKFPAMVAGANLAAQGLNALAAGAIAFVGALGPAVGALGAMPGALATAGAAMGVTKLATAGLSDEIKRLRKEAGEPFVPKAVTDFAKYLVSLEPMLNKLRDTAAKGVLPGFQKGLEQVIPLFPIVHEGVGLISLSIADLAVQGGKMVGTWGKDFKTVLLSSNELVGNLGYSLLGAASALKDVTVEAIPLTEWLGRLTSNFGRYLGEVTAANRANGDLGRFFERSIDTLARLGNIIANVGEGLFNIFRGGTNLGNSLLESLEKITAKFAEWTASVSGQNAIATFFENARAPLHEVALLIRDIGTAFFDLNSALDLADVISQVRTELLPVLKDLLDTSGKLFTEQLITLAAKFAETLTKFGTETGALTMFVKALSTMLDVLNSLANIPGFVEFVATMAILRGTMAAFQFAGFITGFSTLATLIPKVRIALVALFWAITMHPVGALIIAIGLLVAGLVKAYQESETFRAIVDKVWAFVKMAVATAVVEAIGHLQHLTSFWLSAISVMLDGAVRLFGWVPGVGPKLREAQVGFEEFRAGVNSKFDNAKAAATRWQESTVRDANGVIRKMHEVDATDPTVTFGTVGAATAVGAANSVTDAVHRIPRSWNVHVTTSGVGAALGGLRAVQGARHSGGPVYHGGGHVQNLHRGGLKGDEVVAKLQIGEYIIPRAAAKALGTERLENLRNGRAGGNTYNVYVNGVFDLTNPNVAYEFGEKAVRAIQMVERAGS